MNAEPNLPVIQTMQLLIAWSTAADLPRAQVPDNK